MSGRHLIARLVIAACSLTPLPALAAPLNLLVNGSFEEGPTIPGGSSFTTLPGGSTALTGWLVTGSTIDYFGPSWDIEDGERAVDLDGFFSIGGIEQTFPTISGNPYFVSFLLSGNTDGPPPLKEVRVTVDGFSQDYSHSTAGQSRSDLDWELVTFSFIPSGSSATLAFTSLSLEGNSWGAFIDDVSLTPDVVSLPMTMVLVCSGLVFCWIERIRRRP